MTTKLNMTKVEFMDNVAGYNRGEIADWLEDHGVEFNDSGFRDLPIGVYRRVGGLDLIYYGGRGTKKGFQRLSTNGDTEILWALEDEDEGAWDLVLDYRYHPVSGMSPRFTFYVNHEGERTR